jgi:hypothetical protein
LFGDDSPRQWETGVARGGGGGGLSEVRSLLQKKDPDM